MKTSVAVLAETLEREAVWRSASGYDLTLSGVRLLSGSATDTPTCTLQKDLLWVCDKDDAIPLASNGIPVAVPCGEAQSLDELADKLFSTSGNQGEVLVVRAEDTTELSNVLLDVKERLDNWDMSLADAVASRKPLQDVLEIGAEMLANPVAVFDETSGLMSYAGEVSNNYQGTIWEDVLDKGRAPVGYYTAEESVAITDSISNPDKPILLRPRRSPNHENLVLSICNDGQVLGTLAQVDLFAPFSRAQVSLAMRLQSWLTEMFRTTIAGQHHRSPIGHTLRLLIKGDEVETRIARYQLERKGWHIDDRYCLAVIPLPEEKDSSFSGPYREEVSLAVPNSIVIDQDGYLVVLFHLNQRQPKASRDEFIETLRHREGREAPCGVSDEFEFLRARDAWRQARIAVREGGGNGRGGVSTFDETFFPSLLHQMEQTATLSVALSPAALRISQAENGDELLSCIFAYVMSGLNVSRAARALYMHRNTLEYRMGVIRDRWGLDMESMDYDELLRLALSCRLLMQQSLEG